jgi:hypothetical protein
MHGWPSISFNPFKTRTYRSSDEILFIKNTNEWLYLLIVFVFEPIKQQYGMDLYMAV